MTPGLAGDDGPDRRGLDTELAGKRGLGDRAAGVHPPDVGDGGSGQLRVVAARAVAVERALHVRPGVTSAFTLAEHRVRGPSHAHAGVDLIATSCTRRPIAL